MIFKILRYSFLALIVFALFGSFYWNHFLGKRVEKLNSDHATLSSTMKTSSESYQTEIFKLTERLSVLDASIEPENKRWARIKHIRKVITDVLKDKGRSKENIKDVTNIASAVLDFSDEYDMSPALILAVITTESAYNVQAVSHANARGLMQILPETAIEISNDIGKRNYNLFKVKDNIQFGTWYLWKMINHFGDLEMGIRAYNCGPTCVERVRSQEYKDYPSETKKYVITVIEWKTVYENQGVE